MRNGDKVEHDRFGKGFVKEVNTHYVTVFFESQSKALLLDRQTAESHMRIIGSAVPPEASRLASVRPIETDEVEDGLDEETAEELAPKVEEAIASRQELCKCGRPARHRGRCKGSPAFGGRKSRTLSEEVRRETRISRRVETAIEETPDRSAKDTSDLVQVSNMMADKIAEIVHLATQGLANQVTSLQDQVQALSGKAGSKPFEFWSSDPDAAYQLTCSDDVAMLFGAKVPAGLLDAIWYSMNTEMKGRLLSALEIVRYKVRPEDEKPQQ